MRRRIALMLILGVLAACSGCLETHSLDRYGYVIGIGFDQGEALPYRVTLMLQNNQSKSEGEQNAGFTLVCAECRSLSEAISTLSGSLPYTLNFARTALLVFEQSIARQGEAMDELLSIAFSRLRIRYSADVAVSLTSAYEALAGLENETEPSLTKMQMNQTLYSEDTGLIPLTTLKMLMEGVSERCFDAVLPVYGTAKDGQNKPELLIDSDYPYIAGGMRVESEMETEKVGCAIFDGSRMVGLLDGQSTQLLIMVTGDFVQGRILLTGNDGETFDAYIKAKSLPQVTLLAGETPRATVYVQLTAVIEQPEDMPVGREQAVEAAMEAYLTEGMTRLFVACREAGSDAMGFGKCAIKQFSSTSAWQAYEWKTAYRNLIAEFHADVELSQPVEKIGWE